MTDGGEKKAEALGYRTPPRERPIPVWKHVVFAPLLFWVGMFIVAGAAAILWELFVLMRSVLIR